MAEMLLGRLGVKRKAVAVVTQEVEEEEVGF